MKKRILTYRKYIDELLETEESTVPWEKVREEHLTNLAFFQHERLIHLIVTGIFAVLEVICVCSAVVSESLSLLVLALGVLFLLVPYVFHYYLLENEVQRMYGQYDRIAERTAGRGPGGRPPAERQAG